MSVARNLRLVELLMGAPGLPLTTKLLDNAKVFTAAMILTFFTVSTYLYPDVLPQIFFRRNGHTSTTNG